MFQRKIHEIFKGLPNVFDIADDILGVRCDGDRTGHDRAIREVPRVFKLNKQ